MGRLAIRILIIVAIAGAIGVGGFLFRDRLSGAANDLKAGDCFDVPTAQESVSEVQHHPCGEAHTGEIVGAANFPAASNEPYPSSDLMDSFVLDTCSRTFKSYTGRDANTDPVLTAGAFTPDASGWTKGDREVTCFLQRVDQAPMTQSFRLPSS